VKRVSNKVIPTLWTFGGLILIFIGIVCKQYFVLDPTSANGYIVDTVVELFKAVGVALIVIGGINAIIETEHWRHYFEERLKDIVLQQNYLDGLDVTSLEKLHIKVIASAIQRFIDWGR
jgi:hypothetical protein